MYLLTIAQKIQWANTCIGANTTWQTLIKISLFQYFIVMSRYNSISRNYHSIKEVTYLWEKI